MRPTKYVVSIVSGLLVSFGLSTSGAMVGLCSSHLRKELRHSYFDRAISHQSVIGVIGVMRYSKLDRLLADEFKIVIIIVSKPGLL